VAIFALTVLPIYLKEFAGRQAMDAMEGSRSSFCGGASWCTWAFDRILIPNAILIAEGEAYMHASRGWQRVVVSQSLALLADQLVVMIISVGACLFTTKNALALKDAGEQARIMK